ncbi:hypothetical protein F4819DRAFT_180067 [Hypoxylon fuscum]|nr:hypothetical protein F4819DRAFT_180067 [Hypoxylon fuscum]
MDWLLSEWSWQNTPLAEPPADFDRHDTLHLTSYIVNQLRTAKHNDVRDLIESSKSLQRLIRLKELRRNGNKIAPGIELDRQQKMSALAAFVIVPQANTEPCKQCQNKKLRGPCAECVAAGDHLFSGACTNCQFSSSAAACSFYNGTTSKGKKRARRASSEFNGDRCIFDPTPEMLEEMTTAELERAMRKIGDELRCREVPPGPDRRKRPNKFRRNLNNGHISSSEG